VPKVHNKPIQDKRKGSNKGSKVYRRQHGLAHRTVRCATGQCPVHQGIQLQTCQSREFWKPLHNNSLDCPVCQRSNDYFAPTVVCRTHSMRYSARQSQSSVRRHTGQCTVTVRCTTGLSGDPEDRSSNGRTLMVR
jgi:hypothetical protein